MYGLDTAAREVSKEAGTTIILWFSVMGLRIFRPKRFGVRVKEIWGHKGDLGSE
jgi:hypothetical protein